VMRLNHHRISIIPARTCETNRAVLLSWTDRWVTGAVSRRPRSLSIE
jgi:hypothetical protein